MAARARVHSTYSNESTDVGRGLQSNGVNLVLRGRQRRLRNGSQTVETHTHKHTQADTMYIYTHTQTH